MGEKLNNESDIHLSVISHGQWPMIAQLLDDLVNLSCHTRFQLTITFNIKEDYELDVSQYPFLISVIENSIAKGFGANHNTAFHNPPNKKKRVYFVVINPDIRIVDNVFTELTKTMCFNGDFVDNAKPIKQQQKIGVIAPEVTNSNGQIEDSARELPTPGKILAKLFGQRKRWNYKDNLNHSFYQPDWVAGMFMLFKADVYECLGGFNEDYFLYYEDVELCSRLWLEGYQVVVVHSVSVIHNAQRSSHRNLKYLRWHLLSMLRFFLSDNFRQVKKMHKLRNVNDQH